MRRLPANDSAFSEGEAGIVYTRTGRRFFNDLDLERQFLERLAAALTAAGFWDEFAHDLGLPRLRTDAVVGQGPGASAVAVRRSRCGWSCVTAPGGSRLCNRLRIG